MPTTSAGTHVEAVGLVGPGFWDVRALQEMIDAALVGVQGLRCFAVTAAYSPELCMEGQW